jgi:hypothetical protein
MSVELVISSLFRHFGTGRNRGVINSVYYELILLIICTCLGSATSRKNMISSAWTISYGLMTKKNGPFAGV